MTELKILIVDDHWIARAAIIGLLPQLEQNYEVVEAGTVSDAMNHIEEGGLRLIILDLNLPDGDPWDTISHIRNKIPDVPLLVMSVSENRDDVLKCLERGVVGYLPKTSEPEHIVSTIKRVLSGEVALPQRLLLNASAAGSSAISDDAEFLRICALIDGFTPRQREVFLFLADGASNQDIATALGLSVNTVRVHLQSIASKLDTRRRSAIGAYASRWRNRMETAST